MRKTLRPLAGLTAALLALSLAGCGPAGRTGTSHSPAGTASDAAPAGGDLTLITNGNDKGLYTNIYQSDGTGGGRSLRCWVDYAAATRTVLCAKPNCTHDSDFCTAWINPEASETDYLLGDKLLCAGYGMEGTTLTLRGGDGSDPKELYTTADEVVPRLTDGSWLYFEQQTMDDEGGSTNALYRLPLAGGEARRLFDLPYQSGSDAGILGCTGREIVLYTFQWGDDPMPEQTDGMSQEDYDAALAAWEDSQQGSHRVYTKNVDTGEERELTSWTSQIGSAGSTVAMVEGKIYLLPDQSLGELTAIDPADGKTATIPVAWPFEAGTEEIYTITIRGMVGGRLIADVITLEGDDRRAAIDPADGTAAELKLNYLSNGHVRGIRILGQGGGAVLVCYEQRMEDAVSVGSDGMTFVGTDVSERWAMIDDADFLSDTPAYRDVQTA